MAKKQTQKPVTNKAARDAMQTIVNNALLSRAAWMQNLMDPPGRDLNKECGYPEVINPIDYHSMYEREGVARRVVDILPDECWNLDPTIDETPDSDRTDFELAWDALQEQFNLWHFLLRADQLSGIGRFGVILLGLDDGQDLNNPVEGLDEKGVQVGKAQHSLLYLRTFDESVATVAARQTDTSNPRFGLPLRYVLTFQDVAIGQAPEIITKNVHWSRIVHIADDRRMSEVYGTPRMQPVYNRLMDIRKILSGSGEMFWKGAFPGTSFEIDPELNAAGIELDEDKMREQFELYSNGLQRYLAMVGVTAKSLAPQVSDPSNHLACQLNNVAITLKIPLRIFLGSEQAQLASGQDKRTWNSRLQNRQNKYVTPMVVRPFVQRLIDLGIMPPVPKATGKTAAKAGGYKVNWPDLNAPTDQDKAQVGLTSTQALSEYVKGGVDHLVPPEQYLKIVLGMKPEDVQAIEEASLDYEPDLSAPGAVPDPEEGFDDTTGEGPAAAGEPVGNKRKPEEEKTNPTADVPDNEPAKQPAATTPESAIAGSGDPEVQLATTKPAKRTRK